jgi:hypothetical protein
MGRYAGRDRPAHPDPRDEEVKRLAHALKQLLLECLAAGFDDAHDYNWPKAIADARAALKPRSET